MIATIFTTVLLVALALIFARILGYLADRLKQPAVIGEILAGVLLGGATIVVFTGQELPLIGTLPPFSFTSDSFDYFRFLAELGILFLLFISGLSTSLSNLKKMGKPSFFVAVGGIILPFVLGAMVGQLFEFALQESIIIGLILVATSVGVTVRTLMDIHQLDTDVGTTILGAAVMDDVLGILLLAFALGVDTLYSAAFITLKIVLFFLIFFYLGLKIIDRILGLGDKIRLPKALLSITLAIFLIYSFFADACGISGIIGAFVAGLLIGHTIKSRKIIDDVQTIGYGFFIPLFFVWVGATVWEGDLGDLSSLGTTILFAICIIIVAIVGKVAGCGIGARLAGMTSGESLQIGVGMIPRMELALIIASSAVAKGIIADPAVAHQILITTIILTIVTTFLTPILIKTVFDHS